MAKTLEMVISQTSADTLTKRFENNHWGFRHVEAWNNPRDLERPIVGMMKALADYADMHRERYESPVGEDGVLGRDWLAILKACRGLLNGDLGRLDGGTLDGLLCNMAAAAGFEPKDWE